MDTLEKLDQIADIFDLESGSMTPETRLDEIGWDSMGMLGVMALAKQNGKTITGAQLREFVIVADILRAAF